VLVRCSRSFLSFARSPPPVRPRRSTRPPDKHLGNFPQAFTHLSLIDAGDSTHHIRSNAIGEWHARHIVWSSWVADSVDSPRRGSSGTSPSRWTLIDRAEPPPSSSSRSCYQVATGMLSPGDIAPPLRPRTAQSSTGPPWSWRRVTGFDLEGRVVNAITPSTRIKSRFPYESLIVAGPGAGGSRISVTTGLALFRAPE